MHDQLQYIVLGSCFLQDCLSYIYGVNKVLGIDKEDLRRVMDMLSVKEQHARTLLIFHRWDAENLFEVLEDKGKSFLFAEAGVSVDEHRDSDSHVPPDFKEYQLRRELRGHKDEVRGICVCGSEGIATSSRDRTVRWWPLDDTCKFASSKILLGHTSFVGPLAWIPPNSELPHGGVVSGGMDTLVCVWDLKTGEKVHTLKGHQMKVTGVAFDDGDIVSSSVDCTLKRWSNGQSVESWEAHKAPVQAVIKLPSGELVTGSSDNNLKLWRGKTCLHTFQGHSDTVRGLSVMPGLGILSASHDGSLRLWAVSGEVLMEMVGHTAIVYSVDSHASGLIVSGSEDRLAKVWKDGVCVQSIEHPGAVWDAKFMENGDIVTACSDGVVRIWTVDQDNVADQLELELYTLQLSEYKSIRSASSALSKSAHSFPSRSRGDRRRRRTAAGSRSRSRGGLQNTGQNDITFDASFRDLFTAHAYVPGQPSRMSDISAKPTFKHIPKKGMLVFDAADFYRNRKLISEFNNALQSDQEMKKLSLTELNVSRLGAIVKILEDTSHYHSSKFSDSDIALLLNLLRSWPVTMIFPVINIVRMLVLHPHGAVLLHKHFEAENDVLMEVIKKVTVNPSHPNIANLSASIRTVTNLFRNLCYYNWLRKHRSEILDAFSRCCSSPYMNLQLPYSTLLLNYAVLLIETKDQEGQSEVLSAAIEIAEDENVEVNPKFRALVAVGSLMLEGLVRKTALDFDVVSIAKAAKGSKEAKIAEVGSDIELLTKVTKHR